MVELQSFMVEFMSTKTFFKYIINCNKGENNAKRTMSQEGKIYFISHGLFF